MTANSLENSIRVLKKLRDTHSGQLDTSVLVELNEVIADLERFNDGQKDEGDWQKTTSRTLLVIATILRIISDLDDLMK